MSSVFARIATFLRRLLRIVTRSVPDEAGVIIRPYRGYGTKDDVFLTGRVYRQPALGAQVQAGTMWHSLVQLVRRILRWGLADAELTARFGDDERRVMTDRDGYFEARFSPDRFPEEEGPWYPVHLRLVEPADAQDEATGEVYIPLESARYVVISDIDDTVMDTGVANKAKMLWRLFMQRAQQRVAFPGVSALYRAFHDGLSGTDENPLLYVSRGPWSIYEMLVEFFRLNRIPVGPILFLREWGLSLQRPLPQRSENHKLNLIRDMLTVYDDRPFVLIGDSGQHDPEIYAQIVREHPGRVEAVYIRNVSNDPGREDAIERLAEQVAEVGSSLLLAADTYAIAEHAAAHDLISPEALTAILEARRAQTGELDVKATEHVERPTPARTKEAVEGGELDEALDTPEEAETPPNVLVEPEDTTS